MINKYFCGMKRENIDQLVKVEYHVTANCPLKGNKFSFFRSYMLFPGKVLLPSTIILPLMVKAA